MLGFQSGEGDPTRIHRVGRIVPRQDSWCVHHRAHCKGQGGPLARGPLWYPKGWETGGGVLMSATASLQRQWDGGRAVLQEGSPPEGGAFADPRGPLPCACPTACLTCKTTRCRSESEAVGPARAPLRNEARLYHRGLKGKTRMHILKPGLGTKNG